MIDTILQTYDEVKRDNHQRSPSKSPRSASRSSKQRDLKRSQSMHTSSSKKGSEWSLQRSSSRHSFTSDSQVNQSTPQIFFCMLCKVVFVEFASKSRR